MVIIVLGIISGILGVVLAVIGGTCLETCDDSDKAGSFMVAGVLCLSCSAIAMIAFGNEETIVRAHKALIQQGKAEYLSNKEGDPKIVWAGTEIEVDLVVKLGEK